MKTSAGYRKTIKGKKNYVSNKENQGLKNTNEKCSGLGVENPSNFPNAKKTLDGRNIWFRRSTNLEDNRGG